MNNEWNYSNKDGYLSGRSSSANGYAGRWQLTDKKFKLNDGLRLTRNSVRLATVVSELARGVVLFLPAAGTRNGDAIGYVGSQLYYYSIRKASVGLHITYNGGMFATSDGWQSYRGMCIRLATVVSELTCEKHN